MLSKNNLHELTRKQEPKKQRFAIKKLTVGVASVLVGFTFMGLNASVNADTVPSANNGEVTPQAEPNTDKSTADSTKQNETTLNSAPVYTTQGQVPDLDIHSLFTPDQLEQDQIDADGEGTSLTWTQKPDVSKIGNTSGIANLSYPNYDADPTTNDQGDEVYPLKNVSVNVPVLVRKAEQEVKDNQVKNSLDIINSTDNSLVAHYEWVGTKAKNDDEEQPILNSDSVSEDITHMLQSLGFEMDEGSYFPGDITNFGTKNKVATMFVHPISADDQTSTDPKPVIADDPYFDHNGNSSIDNVNKIPNPANYIGNLGVLPQGTKIEWDVAPEYDYTKDGDNYANPEPTNDPSIKVTIPGQAPIILSTTPNGMPLKEIATLPDYGDGTLLLNPDNNLDLGDSVKAPTYYVTNLDSFITKYLEDSGEEATPDNIANFKKSFKCEWTVNPNTQQAGYTFGVFKYNDNVGNLVLFKVNPKLVNNSKTITRTISFTGLPKNPAAVQQKVTYTQNGEQTYVDEPIAWKSDKNSWDEFVVPTVAGYTASVNKIAAKNVNLNDGNETVVVTYTANSHDQVINYVDKEGNKVGNSYTVTGKTGETVDTNIEENMPEGWVISGEYPTKVTFDADDPAAINVLVAKKETGTTTPEVTPSQPAQQPGKSGENINVPADNKQVSGHIGNDQSLTSKISHHVNNTNNEQAHQLPQTGNVANEKAATLGFLFAGLASMFGLAGSQKKQH
ncbi:mucin-binding protein [Limosilactobacillus fastidiosus]|uniref:YSIRK-type signal peptide-containing protein n=1 Tax=Limosilactobacillus fastidiosus TaxID=2759855 RepID=A0A7W3YCS5_9LACO|nr:YSIRK-type signal peptide-containing protein [Limosilactobacillus fastidiosus]MBB1063323.1 YSIRK-type signal peptide-containing protein [Limosilactobacillus fastidiosus]MBB1086297.1 YSIRK-type signal peptide-containing protein [Limosilactobacillus fastidiosus]MCD7084507.1 YSIRK-type signal peptide-containing protein [Limosilactobacillus fastidiosus]MCD7086401.1 YSIRK-type signal peptide-containing protein [Limosilactobacillus fastidiosus]MCD7114243.1 YSIRK-type signal peptide-containing pro